MPSRLTRVPENFRAATIWRQPRYPDRVPDASVAIPNTPLYETADRDDFSAMIDCRRYGRRSSAFDEIIAATEGHYWNPEDPRYLDFSPAFNLKEALLMPASFTPELNCAVADRLDERQRIRLGNELTRYYLSQLLHGEQGAYSLSASLCQIFLDPGAQEYAANQVREEARHVRALSKYFDARWGSPVPVGNGLLSLMSKLVMTGEAYQKIVGMQMMIEGLALGAFSNIYKSANDPVLRRLVQLILTDESYHHRFGRIWGSVTMPELTEEQRARIETWAAGCFVTLFRNMSGWENKKDIYAQFGLDWQWVADAVREAVKTPEGAAPLSNETQIYRVLAKTLLQAGIITERTRPLYNAWFDLNAVATTGSDGFEDQRLADETIRELQAIRRDGNRLFVK
ncbi:MAG TPA: ferritin-like domain-containing protein [Bryobacteraceae bacterium]|nr:ferritin-like domain-containing protein [Bryobacteraceae bacterium]